MGSRSRDPRARRHVPQFVPRAKSHINYAVLSNCYWNSYDLSERATVRQSDGTRYRR